MITKFSLRNLFPDNSNINFLRFKVIGFIASIILVVGTVVSLSVNSLNFGIDFTGGILFEVRLPNKTDLGGVRKILTELEIGDVSIQTLGDERDVMIRLGVKDESKRDEHIEKIKLILKGEFSENIEFRKVEFVGGEVGGDMIKKGITSIIFTIIGIIIYVWYRFNWQYSIGIIAGLLHDLIITVGFLSLTRFEFNTTSIAAILAVLGYSVNDTVVIYDRVRENIRKIRKKPMDYILNLSTNETLSRTLLTVITTLIAVAALVLYGGEALRSFSITVFVGIVVGTYSSIFISVPIVAFFQKSRPSN
jgi:preprotein translocase subunit SecF